MQAFLSIDVVSDVLKEMPPSAVQRRTTRRDGIALCTCEKIRFPERSFGKSHVSYFTDHCEINYNKGTESRYRRVCGVE